MASLWQLNDLQATTSLGGGTGEINLKQTENGFTWHRSGAPSLCLFELPHLATDDESIDAYIRNEDLVVNYGKRGILPFDHQIYWKRSQTGEIDQLECIVSAQTASLDAHSQLSTCTRGSGCREIFHLPDHRSAGLVRVESSTTLTPDISTGCLLIRLGPLSYVEMIQPNDFLSARIEWSGESSDFSLTRPIFDRSLEKGVIVRARACGGWADAAKDEAQMRAAYEAFLTDPLPLTV